MVKEKRILYDHSVDQRGYKWKGSKTLKKVKLSEMPDYLSRNYEKYSNICLNARIKFVKIPRGTSPKIRKVAL